jgi:probable HAF family extracellular repeat protein
MRRYDRATFAFLVGLAVLALAGTASSVGAQAASPRYALVDLGVLDQGATIVIRGLNDGNEVVGGVRGGSRGHRAFLLGSGRLELIDGTTDSDWSTASAISEASVVVGSSNAGRALRAFRFTRGGGARELAPLSGDNASEALGVNRHGDVVGASSGPGGMEAVVWAADGTVRGLGRLPGDGFSRAFAINDAGLVVGRSQSEATRRAFQWTQPAGMRELPALLGDTGSQALAVNNGGEIIGESTGPAGTRAVLWTTTGPRALGSLPGGSQSRALAINDRGEVVGASASSFGTRAVRWTRTGGVEDLNQSIPAGSPFVLTQAVGVNQHGVILAVGHDAGHGMPDHDDHESSVRVFLLVPTR